MLLIVYLNHSGGDGSRQVCCGISLLRRGRGGAEGLKGDGDSWMALMAGDWGRN